MASLWTTSDPRWLALTDAQKAAAMALMEANGGKNYARDSRDVAGAIVNRAMRAKQPLGEHVSQRIYQPGIEPAQEQRLGGILKNPLFNDLTDWVSRRSQGLEPDPVGGATHYLAPESVMLKLEAQNPAKYHNWGPRGANWTGYDPSTGSYKGVTLRDSSHAFLAPEGAYSAPYKGSDVAASTPDAATPPASGGAFAANTIPPILQTDAGREVSLPNYAGSSGAFQTAMADMPKPDVSAQPISLAAKMDGFFPKTTANPTGGLMGAMGGVASAFAGSQNQQQDSEKAAQQALDSANKANATALAQADQSQTSALQDILKRIVAGRSQLGGSNGLLG